MLSEKQSSSEDPTSMGYKYSLSVKWLRCFSDTDFREKILRMFKKFKEFQRKIQSGYDRINEKTSNLNDN